MNQLTNETAGQVPDYDPSALPMYCDYSCAHASFAAEDAVGACRREVAVLCTILNAHVNKNSRCQVRTQAAQNP